MPLPLTISCSSKSRLVLPCWFYLFGAGSARLLYMVGFHKPLATTSRCQQATVSDTKCAIQGDIQDGCCGFICIIRNIPEVHWHISEIRCSNILTTLLKHIACSITYEWLTKNQSYKLKYLAIASMSIANKNGDRTEPYLTPSLILNCDM